MIPRPSGGFYILYRYSGRENGRNVEARICSVPIGTHPDEIPVEIVMKLTPHELAQLKDRLEKDLKANVTGKVPHVIADLDALGKAFDRGWLDTAQIEALKGACDDFSRRFRPPRRGSGASRGASRRDVPAERTVKDAQPSPGAASSASPDTSGT